MNIRTYDPAPLLRRVTLEKAVGGVKKNGDLCGRDTLRASETLALTLRLPRSLGVTKAFFEIQTENGERIDERFVFSGLDGDTETLFAVFSPRGHLCGRDTALFHTRLALHADAAHTFYACEDAFGGLSFTAEEKAAPFSRFLVYADDFSTPDWPKNAVMYHIFVDRFAKGSHPVPLRDGAVIDPDWAHGVPQYPKVNGDALANNVFFGGTLWGIAQRLDDLASRGVTVLYLSPIFEAASNHKYDTGDYETVDAMFGGREALDHLLAEAKARGMRVMLDGVFNHTGDDSRYFDRYGRYGGGAYSSPDSLYRDWYTFRRYPDDYECWWNIPILPRLNTGCEAVRSYFLGENGIVRRYIREGTSGWRLDVADELPEAYLDELRVAVKAEDPDALIIGEVWENAADKVAYGHLRRYFGGHELDSVMNYPVRNAILSYVLHGDAAVFAAELADLYAAYPPCAAKVLMNILGTHDTPRVLTVLAGVPEPSTNDEKAVFRLSASDRERAVKRLFLASVLQYTLPGFPSVYYGDDAGIEGWGDPFCRLPYPWGREAARLMEHYRALGAMRRQRDALAGGTFAFLYANGSVCVYERRSETGRLIVYANAAEATASAPLPGRADLILGGGERTGETVTLPAYGFAVAVEKDG